MTENNFYGQFDHDFYGYKDTPFTKSYSRHRLFSFSENPFGGKKVLQTTPQNEDEVLWRLNVKSSTCFERVLDGFEDKIVYKLKKQKEEAKRDRERRKTVVKTTEVIEKVEVAEKVPDIVQEVSHDLIDDIPDEIIPTNPLKLKARRGWDIIRRYIREQTLKKRKKKSNLQWNTVHYALKQSANMDSAREELYSRYLNPPNPRSWTEGIRSIPPGFFNKRSNRETENKPEVSTKVPPKPKSSGYFYKRTNVGLSNSKSAVFPKQSSMRPSRSAATTAKTMRSSRTWYKA